jgi:hypothetical protein
MINIDLYTEIIDKSSIKLFKSIISFISETNNIITINKNKIERIKYANNLRINLFRPM